MIRGRSRAAAAAALLALLVVGVEASAAPADPCGPDSNDIVCENSKPGNPASEWDVEDGGDPSIQGFATDISVDHGEEISFKVDTDALAYRLDIYRLGYYAGLGARKVATVLPSAPLPQDQPGCLGDPATGLVDCGNWSVSATWDVPDDAVSGIYLARLVRTDTGGASHIVFVVRNDDGGADILFQTSDTTWQAYNRYGGNSLYRGAPDGRAYKVSYNRPFTTREYLPQNWLFNAEYPMLRWLESNGYDVSYSTGVDSARRGGEILEHRVFAAVGHDEYWSAGQRAAVETARAEGVHLAFFSANDVYWKTRWESSIDASGTPFRTLVSYKETHANAKIDPSPLSTGTWRDPRFGAPGDGGRPENALTGTLFGVDGEYRRDAITVPGAYAKLRFWRNTSVASLAPTATATFAAGTLGFEWNEDADNGHRPAGLIHLSETTLQVNNRVIDAAGTGFGPGTATHHLSLYRHASGALVFGAGTIQWMWGLDASHDVLPGDAVPPADARIQQATVNLLGDMGIEPLTLASNMVAAAPSTDTVPPTSTIAAPAAGSTIAAGSTVTVSGTATDAGGGAVGAVEVSIDGGSTWHPATGRETWSYSFTVQTTGQMTLKSRAVDDSLNVQATPASVRVLVPARAGLVAAYAFDEGGGTVAADVSGKGNSGLVGGASWTSAGRFGGALQFDGLDDWVTVPDSDSLDLSGGMTLEAWVNPSSLSGWQTVLMKEKTGGYAYALYANSSSSRPAGYAGPGLGIAGPRQLVANAWAHVAVTYDGAAIRFYLDGSLYGTKTGTVTLEKTGGALRIGGNALWSEWFAGRIDEVRIYDRALTQAEVQGDMASRVGDSSPPTVVLTAPDPSATLSGAVSVTADAADNLGVTGVQFLLDDAPLGPEDTTAPYEVTWSTTTATNGTHRVSALARDGAGNETVAAEVPVTVSNLAVQPPDGLVAAYTFEDGAGSTVTDVSGGGNTAAISGAAWTTSGRYGRALFFDSKDVVTVPDSAALDLMPGMTLEAWVRPTSVSGWRVALVKGTNSSIAYGLFANSGTNRPRGYVRTYPAIGPSQLRVNTWTHLATTYDKSRLRLYVNGSFVASRSLSVSMLNSSGTLRIGGPTPSTSTYFAGYIDDVRIYNRALSQAEIQADMGAPADITPPSVAVSQPTAGAGVAGVTTFAATATDGEGIESVQFSIDGADVGPPDTTAPYTLDWDTRLLANGTHVVHARAADPTGNVGTSAPVSFTVANLADTTAPAVTMSAPTEGATLNGSVSLAADASDDVGVAGVLFRVNGVAVGTEVTSAPFTTSLSTASFGNGIHFITAEARDAAGNRTTSDAVTVTVANAVFAPCPGAANEIACENTKAGSPKSEWDVQGAGDPSLQGFATRMSVNRGETVSFKIATSAREYTLDVYRLGSYGGLGARKVATLVPSVPLPQTQPACLSDPATGLVDCGNWAVSASWDVPADATSGVYVVKLVRPDTGGESHIVFVVRDDDGGSDVLVQTSDTTWQAYNRYGGNSLYVGSPAGRAYKVSYNRPFTTREYANHSWLFSAEYPLIRFLEANGYDVSYSTGIDSDRLGAELLEHRVFMSVGHDEYWSGAQRANVEAARAAGVSLAFLSGNEVFWKTRWEPSIDGSGTSHRTLVSYKETHANAKIDPDAAWTGTWRDPRFTPPADGGRPENSLTGTLFTVNGYREDSLTVPASYAGMRLWRNTSVASLQPGETAAFAPGTLGYEWDEDIANGARPAGLVRLSSTSVDVPALLFDHGSSYRAGTATHALTLYRHAGGALVFGAGTVQWTWGLDGTHDYFKASTPRNDGDVRLRQATLNLLADMRAQPATRQGDLAPASPSTDTTAPTAEIAQPAAGQTVTSGSTVTLSGSAADAGGGVVGAVEVSVDGGSTWAAANGRESWTFPWSATGLGPVTIQVRAVDDSGNLQALPTTRVVSVVCPCSLWGAQAAPMVESSPDTQAVELGLRFVPDRAGYVTALRFYKGPRNTGTHVGSLWTAAGQLLARATFTGETAGGWQEVVLDTPVAVSAGTPYVASYHAPNGGYSTTASYFTSPRTNSPLAAPADSVAAPNGLFRYGSAGTFPNQGYKSTNYWVDAVFEETPPPDTRPPRVVASSPAPGSADADVRGLVTAAFNEALDPASTGPEQFELRGEDGSVVPAGVVYNPETRTATIDPDVFLAYDASYTVRIRGGADGIRDLAGNALVSDHVWTFATAPPRVCPCTIWPDSARPSVASSTDTKSVELGLRFTSDFDGYVTALRFYKGLKNTGTHVGSLWSDDGRLMARATFSDETAEGWQTVEFDGPVAVRADTTYVASYFAPNGGYSTTQGAFAGGHDNPPLRALRDGLAGANGIFRYSASSAFPTEAYKSTNYWVDVIFTRIAPVDTRPPRVALTSPADGAGSADATAPVTVTFSEAVDPATVDGASVLLRGPGGASVPATVTYDAEGRTAVLRPAASLQYGTGYTGVVDGGAGGVTDLAGNPLAADYTWTFTTRACPCTIFGPTDRPTHESSADTQAVELGLKFRAGTTVWATGVRFYKGPKNTGTHTGSLWAADGSLLARTVFENETPGGWQEATFDAAVQLTAGATYVVSYHAPAGGYSTTASGLAGGIDNPPLHALANGADGPNGVFRYGAGGGFPTQAAAQPANYYVDVVVHTSLPADTRPPRVASTSPENGAARVGVAATVGATFTEALDPASVGAAQLELRGPDGSLVPATVSYDAATRTAVLRPSSQLRYSTTYTALVRGGPGGIKDVAGNALAADHSWSFSTPACPCSLWPSTARPALESSTDTRGVELGARFRSDAAGWITAIRFYKGPRNTGTHTGSLWTTSGQLLGRVTFMGETAGGWQEAVLATPVQIAADTTYVVSYYAPAGGYSVTQSFFTVPYANLPLRSPADATGAGNGLFLYGAGPAFPTNSSKSTNYWVDVVFRTSLP